MIIDITGIELTPGNLGKDCLGNGKHYSTNGSLIECCCDECDYFMCCTLEFSKAECKACSDIKCPRCLKRGKFLNFLDKILRRFLKSG